MVKQDKQVHGDSVFVISLNHIKLSMAIFSGSISHKQSVICFFVFLGLGFRKRCGGNS